MKKIILLGMFVIITILVCCNKKNPVWDVEPVTNAFYTDASGKENFPLAQFHELGEKGDTTAQRKLVDQYRKQLTANVVKQYPQVTNERNIKFVLGSGFAKDVQSGDGETYSGKFKNELIIIIIDPAVKDTVFLSCGNGMLSPLELKESYDFGTAEQWRFTILPGEGLAHHLPKLQAWADIANKLSIPIKDENGRIVSQKTYLNYLGRYESILFPYDVVDILNGKVYNQAGQEVNFKKRQEETKNANRRKPARAAVRRQHK